jgi:hypothetical protein
LNKVLFSPQTLLLDIFYSLVPSGPGPLGDTPLGYIGFTDAVDNSKLISNGGDGAIDMVLSGWRT